MKDHAQTSEQQGEIGGGWLLRILLSHNGRLTLLPWQGRRMAIASA